MIRKSLRSKDNRKRSGVLFWVVMMLFSSAVLRLGVEIGPALAREQEPKEIVPAVVPESKRKAPEVVMQTSEDLEKLLRELQRREMLLQTRERQIEDRMQALKVADEAIAAKLLALTNMEEALRKTLAMADGASERDLESLTSVYNNMKPKEAAGLFETMDPAFAAGFLARMRPETAAGIMAKLSPDAAYSISVILAGRNTGVPKK